MAKDCLRGSVGSYGTDPLQIPLVVLQSVWVLTVDSRMSITTIDFSQAWKLECT